MPLHDAEQAWTELAARLWLSGLSNAEIAGKMNCAESLIAERMASIQAAAKTIDPSTFDAVN